ncbi:MAG TPA: fumarate hydratase [Acetobacteraceae bacterium]|nr:fumarate hydratase [Acetobacteraceae bacterium]
MLKLDMVEVEGIARDLYIRALKLLPDDVKSGFARLRQDETDETGQTILETMVRNVAIAERTKNLLCQDTGIPIYNVLIGRDVDFEGVALKEALRRGCERATREHPLRSSIVHPITRRNEQTSCGPGVPVIHVDFIAAPETAEIEMIPKGSGSENGSFLRMLVPADGVAAVKRFVIDRVIEAGGKVCPPTIVGVGIGGTSDLCMHLAKLAATRPLGSKSPDSEGAKLEAELSATVNELGIGPQGLGGRSTAFAVHVEIAATHITMNPVAVNIQCHSARRARAVLTPGGVRFGF